MLAALALLAVSTTMFAYARTLPELFAARMLQGAADAVTWVVGFALITDMYDPSERGWAMGLVMSGASLGVILGPTLGGWLYEVGGITLPFLVVAALATVELAVFAVVAPRTRGSGAGVRMSDLLAQRPILVCTAAVVAGAATIAMLEPVIPLFFEAHLGLGPAAIGSLFGGAALVSALTHPVYGRLSDRWGGRRLMLLGSCYRCAAAAADVRQQPPVSCAGDGAAVGGAGPDRHAVPRVHGGSRCRRRSRLAAWCSACARRMGRRFAHRAVRGQLLFERVGFGALVRGGPLPAGDRAPARIR